MNVGIKPSSNPTPLTPTVGFETLVRVKQMKIWWRETPQQVQENTGELVLLKYNVREKKWK